MRRRFPSLSLLITFEVVYRLQNISAAANELSLTQSAVSRKIQLLEEFIEQPLFERHSSGLTRTTSADLLWARLPNCLDELESILSEVVVSKHGGGVLNLATIPTFAAKWLMPRLSKFRTAHPELTVNLTIKMEHFEFAGSGFDAGIVFGRPDGFNCEHHLITEETQVVVCSPEYLRIYGRPKAPQDARNFTLLHSTSRSYAWPLWFENHGMTVSSVLPGLRFELFSMVVEAAKAGFGLGLVPEIFVSDEIKRRSLIKLFPAEKQTHGAYYFVYPKRRSNLSRVITFQNWLLKEANSQNL